MSFPGEVLLDALLFGLDLQVGVEVSKPRVGAGAAAVCSLGHWFFLRGLNLSSGCGLCSLLPAKELGWVGARSVPVKKTQEQVRVETFGLGQS